MAPARPPRFPGSRWLERPARQSSRTPADPTARPVPATRRTPTPGSRHMPRPTAPPSPSRPFSCAAGQAGPRRHPPYARCWPARWENESEVERDGLALALAGGEVVGTVDRQLERPVLRVLEREVEQEHRGGRRPLLRHASGLGNAVSGPEPSRLVGKRVVRLEMDGLELVALVVFHAEARRGLMRLVAGVAGLEEDAVERVTLGRRFSVVVGAVRRDPQVELAREVHVVVHTTDLDEQALTRRLVDPRFLLVSARRQADHG